MIFKQAITRPAPSRRLSADGYEILVFDGLVNARTVRQMYEFLRGAEYRWNSFDSLDTAHSIRWKADLPLKSRNLPFFSDIDRFVCDVTEIAGLRMRRIYANFNLYGEVHYPHIDGANVVTAIYFANMEWEPAWSGETVFFENGEPSHVVAPKPGRLLLFDGRVTHRGSPPTRDCFEPRLNVVFKFGIKSGKAEKIRGRQQKGRASGFYSRVVRPPR